MRICHVRGGGLFLFPLRVRRMVRAYALYKVYYFLFPLEGREKGSLGAKFPGSSAGKSVKATSPPWGKIFKFLFLRAKYFSCYLEKLFPFPSSFEMLYISALILKSGQNPEGTSRHGLPGRGRSTAAKSETFKISSRAGPCVSSNFRTPAPANGFSSLIHFT